MRSLASFLLLFFISPRVIVATDQQAFHYNNGVTQSSTVLPNSNNDKISPDDAPNAFAESIISLLSASSQHTTFLHLLQRAKAVPMLAHIGSSTVFAPTDAAWEEWAKSHQPPPEDQDPHLLSQPNEYIGQGRARGGQGWLGSGGLKEWLMDEESAIRLHEERLGGDKEEARRRVDNQNWALRQHLLYHMLNYTLSPSDLTVHSSFSSSSASASLESSSWSSSSSHSSPPSALNVTTETTLLFPLLSAPPLPPTPPPGPPWLPRGGEGLLAGHGQRLRIARAGSIEGEERGKVGVDWDGKGGVSVWEGKGWPRVNYTSIRGVTKGNGSEGGGGGSQGEKRTEGLAGARWAKNGVVVGIEGVLEPPASIEEIIKTHPSLTYLSHLLTPLTESTLPLPLPPSLATSPHLTIFAPSDAAWSVLDNVERRYLESEYGEEGVARILAAGVVTGTDNGGVGWKDMYSKTEKVVVGSSGINLTVAAPSEGVLKVNGTQAEIIDIFASNGVIHIMPNLLIPSDFSLLNTVEKVLLSLNATRFVSLLRAANISSTYVGEPGHKDSSLDKAWTILAPTDEVIDLMEKWGGHGAPLLPQSWYEWTGKSRTIEAIDHSVMVPTREEEIQVLSSEVTSSSSSSSPFEVIHELVAPKKDASPLAALLQYHILPGRLVPGDIKDGMLVGTEMRTNALGGERQRLRVEVSDHFGSGKGKMDWEVAEGEIRFGEATVLGTPGEFDGIEEVASAAKKRDGMSGKSIIYLISTLLSPPLDVLQTAVSDLQLSTYVAAVYAADLDRSVLRTPATTYFIPRNKAFAQLGLAMNYLLLPEGKDELRKVLKYHSVDKVIYLPDVEVGRTVYHTLEGGEVVIERVDSQGGKGNEDDHGVGRGSGSANVTSTIYVQSPTHWSGHDSGGSTLPSNGELRPAQVIKHDALTETGVIHILDSVALPADVKITNAKLIRGSKQTVMADLMVRAGLGWILEGRGPSSGEVERVGLSGLIRAWDDDESRSDEGSGRVGGGIPPDQVGKLAFPSYTVLVPTDKAWSRLNLTQYTTNEVDLLNLLKLHIIPSQSTLEFEDGDESGKRKNKIGKDKNGKAEKRIQIDPPKDGQPLALADDLIYSTLLSPISKFGDLAVRATGDNGFLVGVRNARGGSDYKAAKIGVCGRASVRWRTPSPTDYDFNLNSNSNSNSNSVLNSVTSASMMRDEDGDDIWSRNDDLWSGGMTLGGGVIIIDTVLRPYEPNWFEQYGALVLTLIGLGVVILVAAAGFAWWWYTRDKIQYETLEGEEDE